MANVLSHLFNIFPRKSLSGQFLRYIATGGLAFAIDFGLFALCLYVFKWHYLIANLAGLMAGLILNYALSILWVFATCKRAWGKRKIVEFTLFSLIGFVGIGFNQLLMYLMVDDIQLNEMLSKIVAALLTLMWNFGIRKFFLFRQNKSN